MESPRDPWVDSQGPTVLWSDVEHSKYFVQIKKVWDLPEEYL